MRPASWALLRNPWARTSRPIAEQAKIFASSLPAFSGIPLRHSLTFDTFRLIHSSEQQANVQNFFKDYPIDVFNTQTTVRQLLWLIQSQKLKDASALMADFLSAIPTDDVERLAAFRKLKTVLVKQPRSNLSLIMQLGIGYASVGYVNMVREEILPLVKYFASPENLAHFKLEMDILSLSEKDKANVIQDPIFEVNSLDYHPSVTLKNFSTTVDENLVPLEIPLDRAAYYPEGGQTYENLSEVFEDEGDEYLVMESTKFPTDHESIQSTGVLRKLVLEGHYGPAYLLLKEVQDLGIQVPPSVVYERAAVSVLRNPKLSLEDKLECFTSWFVLVPMEHLVPPTTDFAETRRLLLQSHLMHISIVIRFSLILAEKGYADRLSVTLIPQVLRCTSPEVGRAFLEAFCNAHKRYILDPNNKILNQYFKIRKTLTNVRGQAVRALAYSGRLDEAIALFPDPDNPDFKLTTYTYNIVLQRSWALPKEIRQHNIDLIRRLRGSSDSAIRTPATIVEEVREGEINESELTSGETAKPIDFGEDLVAILRYLKKHIAKDKKLDTTHPFTLVNFMSMYLATGRTRALKMLLDKAIRKSFFATSNFLFAEMLFYRRLKQPNLVIKTFMDHFWLSGVPREEVMMRYLRIDSIYRNYDSSSGEDPPLQRFYPFDPSSTLPRGKIWPSKRHCNLIWDALVELTTNERELEVLYKKLIYFAEQGFDSPRSEVVVKADEVPIPGHWHAPVGAAAFTPFMQRLMFAQGPSFGVRILRDMLQLGIPPTTYHYTELAGFYARKGDDRKVFLILDGMERCKRRDLPERNTNTPQRGISGPVEEYYLPPPTLVTYTSILRGFLIAKHLDGAERVFARLKLFCDYVPGQAATLDLAIQDLEDFSKAGETWVCRKFP